MTHIGLARGTVRLEPYDPAWYTMYASEAQLLRNTLDIPPEHIQHVGSTSIPGMVAKPIIDIAIRVDTLERAEQWEDTLASLGYWYKGLETHMPHRRFFAKGPESKRTVYLHIVDRKEFERLIKFRDFLRANPEAAAEYAELKQRLASDNANNRARYSQLKNDFIQSILNL